MPPNIQFNDCGEKPTELDRTRWLPIIERCLFGSGISMVVFGFLILCVLLRDPVYRLHDVVYVAVFALLISGVGAVLLSFLAIRLIRKRMLERFCEIDELKTEIRELKNEWTQR